MKSRTRRNIKMAKIYGSTLELIGNTPLVEVKNIEKSEGLEATVLVKLEYFNPAGSVKDRVALYMLLDAQEKGLLKKDSVIIEPTSGNTGIGLAAVAAEKGIRTIIVMPDTMSIERRNILKAYGAELVLTDGSKGMTGAIQKAEELQKEIPGSIIAGQFVNEANPRTHYNTTGPEIYEDTDGKVDIFLTKRLFCKKTHFLLYNAGGMCYKIITLVNKLTQRSSDFFSFLFLFLLSRQQRVATLRRHAVAVSGRQQKMPSPAYAVGGHCMFKIPITFFPVRSRR